MLEASAGQIALRFPTAPVAEPGPTRDHLNRIGSGLNGQAKGQDRRGFTGLAVVLLSQLTGDYGGNFTVWPGSHIFFENHFKEHGHEILGEGMPKVDLPNEPVQITGEPGDAILAHHQIVHTAAPNTSSHIRYATIFRLRHKDCDEIGTRRLHRYMARMARHPGGADRTGSSTAEAPIPGPLAHIGKRG